MGLGVFYCRLGQTPHLWPHVWTADLGAKTLSSTVGSAANQQHVSHTSCFPGGSAGLGTSPGDVLLLGTRTTLCHRPLLQVKRVSSPMRVCLVTVVPFPQPGAWWQTTAYQERGGPGAEAQLLASVKARAEPPALGPALCPAPA